MEITGQCWIIKSSYIYSNCKSCINEFIYDGNLLQILSNIVILVHATLKCNGSFNFARAVLMERARKADFKIK